MYIFSLHTNDFWVSLGPSLMEGLDILLIPFYLSVFLRLLILEPKKYIGDPNIGDLVVCIVYLDDGFIMDSTLEKTQRASHLVYGDLVASGFVITQEKSIWSTVHGILFQNLTLIALLSCNSGFRLLKNSIQRIVFNLYPTTR